MLMELLRSREAQMVVERKQICFPQQQNNICLIQAVLLGLILQSANAIIRGLQLSLHVNSN